MNENAEDASNRDFEEHADGGDPFELMEMFGWVVTDDEEDELDEEEWDRDVYWANIWAFAFPLGSWGQFADGLESDGSRKWDDSTPADELSVYDHILLVLESRQEERIASQDP